MHIRWNEYTSLSRFGAIILFVGVFPVLSFYLGMEYQDTKMVLLAEEPEALVVLAAAQGARVGWKLHENSEYGFSIAYPPSLSAETSFSKHHALGTLWSVGGLSQTEGKALLSVSLFRAEERGNPSRYYSAELRIGVSENSDAVAECLLSKNGEVGVDAVIGDTTFRTFPIEEKSSLGYVAGTSYRAVHGGRCFAIEELESGDLKGGGKDIPDSSLRGAFDDLHALTETFRFTISENGTGGI